MIKFSRFTFKPQGDLPEKNTIDTKLHVCGTDRRFMCFITRPYLRAKIRLLVPCGDSVISETDFGLFHPENPLRKYFRVLLTLPLARIPNSRVQGSPTYGDVSLNLASIISRVTASIVEINFPSMVRKPHKIAKNYHHCHFFARTTRKDFKIDG